MKFKITEFEKNMLTENMNHPSIVAELVKNGVKNYELTDRLKRKWARVQMYKENSTNEDKACYYQDELDVFAKALIQFNIVVDDRKQTELPKLKSRKTDKSFLSLMNSLDTCADEDLEMDLRYKNGHYEPAVNLR